MRFIHFATMNFINNIFGSIGSFGNIMSIRDKLAHGADIPRMIQPSQTIKGISTGMEEGCGKNNYNIDKTATGLCGSLKRKRKTPQNHSSTPKHSRKMVSACNPYTPRMGREQDATVRPRGKMTIHKAINTNPKYKTMRLEVESISKHCAETKRCPICLHRIEINGKAIRTAIDHLHEMEDHEVVCAFRALLCQRCNTTEGQALKEANKNGTDHVEVWMRKRFGGELTPKSKSIVKPRMVSLLSKGRSITPILFDLSETDEPEND